MPTDEAPEPAREIPYVGPTPFRRADQALFFGRDHEANELLSHVTAHPVVLLYSQSGAGKTSLLNASLIPMLEGESFDVVGPARVRGKEGGRLDFGATNPYVHNALASLPDAEAGAGPADGVTLGKYLQSALRTDEDGHLVRPCVLVFDQFEELFTHHPEFWEYRRDFFEQVAQALADPLLRVLFAMREDFIAELDPYESQLPEKLRTRFRLERLREQAAQEAITGPLGVEPWAKLGRRFAEGVAEKLVNNLREIPSKTDARGRPVLGEFVEPVQLQIVCESIWRGLGEDDTLITERHLEEFGDINQALTTFYERCIMEAVEAANKEAEKRGGRRLSEGALRAWFDGVLISETGKRAVVYRALHTTGGIPNAAVDVLERKHLIKAELRDGDRWYELSHDRFIQPIKESYKNWLLRRPAAERTLLGLEERAAAWYKRKDPALLLGAVEAPEVRAWLDGPEISGLTYSPRLDAYVNASEAARERAERETERELAAQREMVVESERLRAEEQAEARKREVETALAFAEQQRRSSRRLRWALVASLVLLVSTMGAGAWAVNSARAEGVARREAIKNLETANGLRILAQEEAEKARGAEKMARVERDRAVEQTRVAEEAKKHAEEARAQETLAKNEAQEQTRRATTALAAEARARQAWVAAAQEARQQQALYELRIPELEKEVEARTDDQAKLQERFANCETALRDSQETLKKLEATCEVTRPKDAAAFMSDALQHEANGNLMGAAASYARAFDLFYPAEGKPSEAINAGVKLGSVFFRLKNYPRARQIYERVAKLYPDEKSVADFYRETGDFFRRNASQPADRQEAQHYLGLALNLYGEVVNEEGRAATLDALGDVHRDDEQYDVAVEKYKEARNIYHRRGNKPGEAQMDFMIGYAYQSKGDKLRKTGHEANPSYREAVNYYKLSLEKRAPDDVEGRISTLTNLGGVHRYLGETYEALKRLQEAQELQKLRGRTPNP